MQSAYRSNFSTETALLKLQNDVLSFFDQQRSVFLVSLDLSAAFDTVDHALLLNRLESRFRISGLALRWFKSYLTGWSSRVNIAGELSDPWVADFGVPQGSVLGPILFSLYITPISDIINKHGLQYICYADDIQLYSSFDPRSFENMNDTLNLISLCISEINTWMSSNYLQLNNNKTEFIAFCASARHLQSISHVQLNVNGQHIPLSSKITDLGVCIDTMFTLSSHVNHVVRNCNYHLRNLWRIRRFIDFKTCHHAVRALILSRLDYCNSLFTVLCARDRRKLESIQNRAARLIFGFGSRTHTSPLLKELHWLPLHQRIQFKVCLYVFKILNHLAPEYLNNTLKIYTPSRNLRSVSDTCRLNIPISKLSSAEKRFTVAASKTWNAIPLAIRVASSIPSFKVSLKTFLFPQ